MGSQLAGYRMFSEQVISSIIDDSRCGMSNVGFHTAPPNGGLLLLFYGISTAKREKPTSCGIKATDVFTIFLAGTL